MTRRAAPILAVALALALSGAPARRVAARKLDRWTAVKTALAQNPQIAAARAEEEVLRAQGRHSRRFVHLSNPEEVEASQPSPEEALRLRESDAELQEILSNLLDPAEWDLLRMRFWEDRSISEMAAIIKLPYHAVAMRLHRLQKKLVEVLKSRYFPEQ